MTPDPKLVEASDGAPAGYPMGRSDKKSEMEPNGESGHDAAESSAGNGSLRLLFGFICAILAIGFLRSWWFPGILAGLLFMPHARAVRKWPSSCMNVPAC